MNPLLDLTPTQLQRIRGTARDELISYLKAWQEEATLLRYLEAWLGSQPNRATLRQARAETLIALGQAEAALHELDALDAERSATESRIVLRLRALIAMQAWDAVEALLANSPLEAAQIERWRGDVWVAQGQFDRAATCYALAGVALSGSQALTQSAIEYAVAQAQWAAAWLIIESKRNLPHHEPRPTELRLALRLAEQLDDPAMCAQLRQELAERELHQRSAVLASLGLDETALLEAAPLATPTIDTAWLGKAHAWLQEHWGYPQFRGQQAPVVSQMLAGEATLAVLPTGAGKSLTYQLPAFLLDGATVVVSPLIALMKDQLDGLPPALRTQATAINSTLRPDELGPILQQVRAGQFKLVYVAPERLRQQSFVQALRQAGIARFVVDEAHCVSLWGLSFRPDYLFLKRVLAELGQPPVLAVTATATPDTQVEIKSQLGNLRVVTASVFRSNLQFSVVPVANSEAKVQALVEVCQRSTGAVVVYARAREQCERLAQTLREHGVRAAHYHAGVEDRATVQEQFMRDEVRVLVATIAFGMGVDKADVRMIVHYNLPQSVEAYYQEAGRAGRDGQPAECVLLYTTGDKGQLTSWLRQDTLTKDDLRALYKVLRSKAQHGFTALHPDSLQAELTKFSETQLRVMLGMLERVGLIIRHFDLPRTMSITLQSVPDEPDFALFMQVVRVRVGQRVSFAPIETAINCGWRPDELEARLLVWQARGFLRYQGVASDLLLELLPAPADTAERIDALIADYSNRQDARIASMVAYAKSLNCRHRALAAHFGEHLAACGEACDICLGTLPALELEPLPTRRASRGPALRGPAVAQAILRTVRDLPFAVGRTGLAHILVGSAQSLISAERCRDWGALAAYSRSAVIDFIDDLLAQGFLLRSNDDDRPLLRLADKTHRALLSPTNLPDLAPETTSNPESSFDDRLYQALESWRRQIAQARGVPAYIVCANATLRDIATHRPRTLLDLGRIKGVGPKTLEQYGGAVLEVIASHR